jgi:hypothetical protein
LLSITSRLATLALAAALLAAAAVGAISRADAAQKAKTKISIEIDGDEFSGAVRSHKRSCKRHRKVILYKLAGKKPRPSRDDRIGSYRTDESSPYLWFVVAKNSSGKFYAYAKATRSCKKGRSKVIRGND